jgi:hypothetical protein
MTGVDRGKAVLAPGPFIRSRRPHPLTNYSLGRRGRRNFVGSPECVSLSVTDARGFGINVDGASMRSLGKLILSLLPGFSQLGLAHWGAGREEGPREPGNFHHCPRFLGISDNARPSLALLALSFTRVRYTFAFTSHENSERWKLRKRSLRSLSRP